MIDATEKSPPHMPNLLHFELTLAKRIERIKPKNVKQRMMMVMTDGKEVMGLLLSPSIPGILRRNKFSK
jgi:hypothetical protein